MCRRPLPTAVRKRLTCLHDLVADVMAGRADAVDAKRLAELVAELSSEDDMDEGERTQARNEATAVHKETRHPVTEEERAARQAAKAELRRKRKEAEERTAALQDSTAGGSGLSGRKYTVSIAIPGSIIDNAQSGELRTMVAGQLSRAAAVFQIDEIVIFEDYLGAKARRARVRESELDAGTDINDTKAGGDAATTREQAETATEADEAAAAAAATAAAAAAAASDQATAAAPPKRVRLHATKDPVTFLARILQYLETPQYLRKALFPVHPDLKFAGMLHPLDTPHHMRESEWSRYREGVVVDPTTRGKRFKPGKSLVDVGLKKLAIVSRGIQPGTRLTVDLGANHAKPGKKGYIAAPCPPSAPRERHGTYWGYSLRIAEGLKGVLDNDASPFKDDGGYDLVIGTSERGDVCVDEEEFAVPSFKHLLLVFGGPLGIEESVEADPAITLDKVKSSTLFDMWLNTCPIQGSRTIRSEEALFISLAALRPFLEKNKVPTFLS